MKNPIAKFFRRVYLLLDPLIRKDFIRCLVIDFKVQGRFCGFIKQTEFRHRGHGNITSTPICVMDVIFNYPKLKIHSDDVILDAGCGKGRVINYLVYKNLGGTQIGVEFDEGVFKKTKRFLAKRESVQIIHGDILDNFPNECTIISLFNPFDEKTMEPLVDIIKKSKNFDKMQILYWAPSCPTLFINDPSFETTIINVPYMHNRDQFLYIRSQNYEL